MAGVGRLRRVGAPARLRLLALVGRLDRLRRVGLLVLGGQLALVGRVEPLVMPGGVGLFA
ncbi:hypothetical protein [Streptomyces sp. NPDC087297]|uniref:hypothetical protein n=1 Tax=Streptomyces sp. NPDC087297 TaxID=3365778 RepID=UPI003803D9A0